MAAVAQIRATTEMSLAGVAHGTASIILHVLHPPDVTRQLAHLGVVPGAVILVRRSASFGGPLFIEVRGSTILIARKLARKIQVRILP